MLYVHAKAQIIDMNTLAEFLVNCKLLIITIVCMNNSIFKNITKHPLFSQTIKQFTEVWQPCYPCLQYIGKSMLTLKHKTHMWTSLISQQCHLALQTLLGKLSFSFMNTTARIYKGISEARYAVQFIQRCFRGLSSYPFADQSCVYHAKPF